MHVEILQRIYQVTSSAVALPGEEERVYVIAFLPRGACVDFRAGRGGRDRGDSRVNEHDDGAIAMNTLQRILCACLASLAFAGICRGEDRLTLTANGSTLTGTNGGAGGSLGWLHNFNPDVLLGAGVEYQRLGDARWKFGSLNGAWTGGGEGRRWSLYGEGHKGTGDDAAHDFTYQIFAVGASVPLFRKLSLQLEDKQIDVDTTHGNLPKIGLSLVWTPRLQTAISYAHSVGGNLGTDIGTVRLDYYAQSLHYIVGGAFGPADTVVLNLPPGVPFPSRSLREGFLGFSRLYRSAEFLDAGGLSRVGQ